MKQINKKIFTGLHIFGELRGTSKLKLDSLTAAKARIRKIISDNELNYLGSYYHKFTSHGGFTGVVCLAESHIALHTWPELNYLTLDVFLCNYTRINNRRCHKVFQEIVEYFSPYIIKKRFIKR